MFSMLLNSDNKIKNKFFNIGGRCDSVRMCLEFEFSFEKMLKLLYKIIYFILLVSAFFDGHSLAMSLWNNIKNALLANFFNNTIE